MKEQIEFSEFLEIEKKLEIRMGTITSVEKMEKSDKMLKLTVDFGTETRVVMTNIGNRIGQTNIVDCQMPFIMNLKPAMIMGVESAAMIMVAENSDGELEIRRAGYSNGAKLL